MPKKDELKILSDNIQKLKEKNSLTKQEMAQILGIDMERMDEIERVNYKNISHKIIFKIGDYFKIPYEDVLKAL